MKWLLEPLSVHQRITLGKDRDSHVYKYVTDNGYGKLLYMLGQLRTTRMFPDQACTRRQKTGAGLCQNTWWLRSKQSSSEFHDEHCPFWLGPACGTKQTSFTPHPSWPALRISHAPSFARYPKQSAGASVAGRQLAVLPVDCIGDIFGSKNTDTCKKIGKLREAVQVLVMIFFTMFPKTQTCVLSSQLDLGVGSLTAFTWVFMCKQRRAMSVFIWCKNNI